MYRPHLPLTWALAALVALACLTGLLWPPIYAREAAIWAAQGQGQDALTLVLALPLLLVSAQVARAGRLAALLLWAGVLVYLVYSYVLYAFFVHFGVLFPVYVAVLGLSFYLLAAFLAQTEPARVAQAFSPRAPLGLVAGWLIVAGVLFFALWSVDVFSALVQGRVPPSVQESGLLVNPVHVLDMGLFLPGIIITGVLLRRRHALGLLFAAPLLVCMVVLGLAVLCMFAVMVARGMPGQLPPVIAIGSSTLVSAVVLARLLGALRR